MPVNRNALIRYRTIDNCLRNRQRRWTLEDLMDACSDALYEYEGIDKGVSKRSVQMDIQLMRSDKLGYNAPIVVLEKKYYTYEDPAYSITNIPLTDQDLGKLTEVVEILRQFKGFSHFQELSGMVQRLENKIYSARTHQEPIIDFEKNENLKGLEYIDTLYQAIMRKVTVQLVYHSFRSRKPNDFTFHPYYLKEYRNRWFVLGVKGKGANILTLALDRIEEIRESSVKYIPPGEFNLNRYYHDVIGVTVDIGGKPEHVVFFAEREAAPYIVTKPVHHSQQVVEVRQDGTVFSIDVQLNFELEREILGFGDRVKVIAPERFKRRIKEKFEHALDQYLYEFNNNTLLSTIRKVEHKGHAILHSVFRKKQVNDIRFALYEFQKQNPEEKPFAIRNLLGKVPALAKLLFNANVKVLLDKIDPGLFLTKAIYFDKPPDADWYVTWHQDTTIHVKEKIETEGFSGWTKKEGYYGVVPPVEVLQNTVTLRIHLDDTNEHNGALKVIQGSHNKRLRPEEIQLISQNNIPLSCDVLTGGIHLMKPLLLHSSAKTHDPRHRRVVHLEFTTSDLPNGLEWAERFVVGG